MRQENINLITLRAAASVNSSAVDARNLFYCSAQIAVTGAGAGTLKLQVSNDIAGSDGNPGSPSNWSDVPSASIAISGAGAYLIPKTDMCYQWARLVYTNSGTGTINAIFKALGA